jgi:hypothetical protein
MAEPVTGAANRKRSLTGSELESALQLLVERAQFITGATGSALALPHGDEMVCRASSGSSAPAVGARLQVRSGLTGESVLRRQVLRCDNAETDPRVNLEACRALGIASIVVLPLLRGNGEVRGLFELFSDHPYAFEERDLIALERMADLTLTALDLAEQPRQIPATTPVSPSLQAEKQQEKPVAYLDVDGNVAAAVSPKEALAYERAAMYESPSAAAAAPAPIPDAMRRAQKCATCGFPVSEGRSLCLDCEKKEHAGTKAGGARTAVSAHSAAPGAAAVVDGTFIDPTKVVTPAHDRSGPAGAAPVEEFVPAFLANAPPVSDSWMANHVNLLAVLVLVLGILVFVVVFVFR